MRLVAKIGTSSITDALGVIDNGVVDMVCDQLAALRADGHEVILVSSGAVSAGVAALGMAARPTDMPTLQAISAAGQSRLMETYNRSLGRHHLVAAQVLLVPHDFVDRRQYLHARQTLLRLIELGCIPIINENDAIASHELRYGDNDRIAALVAHNVNADLLVLLTDTAGPVHRRPTHRLDRRADQRGRGRRARCSPRRSAAAVRAGGAEAWRRSSPQRRWPRGRELGRSSQPPIVPMCWSTPLPA